MTKEINLQLMWRRMYLRIQELINQNIDDRLRPITSGGKVPASVISGSDPGLGIGVLIATGDLLTFQSGVTVRLPIGLSGQVLTVVGGMPTWMNPPTPIINILLIDDSSVQLSDSASVDLTTN